MYKEDLTQNATHEAQHSLHHSPCHIVFCKV